jgi:hypothetical protein
MGKGSFLVLMLAAQLSKPHSNTGGCKFSQGCEAARQLCAVTDYRGMGGSDPRPGTAGNPEQIVVHPARALV